MTSPGWPTHPRVAQHNVITWLYVSILPMTDIDSGNGLLPEGTKPLAEQILKLIPGMTYVIREGVSLFFFKPRPFCVSDNNVPTRSH